MKKNIYYEYAHDNESFLTAHHCENCSGYVPAHFHRSIELIYVLKGEVECVINDEKFIAKQNDIIFTKRCGIHELTYSDGSATILLVIPPKYSNDFNTVFQTKTIHANLSDTAFNVNILPYFKTLADKTETSDMVIKGFINIIIGKIFDYYPTTNVENLANLDIIVDVLNYIDKHYREPISLDSISAKFGYNKYYFSRLFNDSIGANLNNYLNVVRLRNLLNDAKKIEKPNLSKLIYDYGFDSFSTFYRTCSLNYNLSPKELLNNKNLN